MRLCGTSVRSFLLNEFFGGMLLRGSNLGRRILIGKAAFSIRYSGERTSPGGPESSAGMNRGPRLSPGRRLCKVGRPWCGSTPVNEEIHLAVFRI